MSGPLRYEYHKIQGRSIYEDALDEMGKNGWYVVGMTYDAVTMMYTVLMEREYF